MDRDMLEYIAQSDLPVIDMCGGDVEIAALEVILEALRMKGCVTVKRCGKVANLLELGAQLREIGQK